MKWIYKIIEYILKIFFKGKINTPTLQAQQSNEEKNKNNNIASHYQAKYLLTRNEWYEYKKLREYSAIHNLQVCPKVRLLDIVEPRRGDPNYMSYMGRIKSKHIDFVICDQDLRIKGIIELDDNSHKGKDRYIRDIFVDAVLQGVGYTVIRTRSITENTLEPIVNKSKNEKQEHTEEYAHIKSQEPTYEEWKAAKLKEK